MTDTELQTFFSKVLKVSAGSVICLYTRGHKLVLTDVVAITPIVIDKDVILQITYSGGVSVFREWEGITIDTKSPRPDFQVKGV